MAIACSAPPAERGEAERLTTQLPEGFEAERLRAQLDRIASVVRLLANADRLLLLWKLSQREMCVAELEDELDIHQPTLSQQLKVLRDEGAVRTRRDGKHIYYSGVSDPKLRELVAFLYRTYPQPLPQAAGEPVGQR